MLSARSSPVRKRNEWSGGRTRESRLNLAYPLEKSWITKSPLRQQAVEFSKGCRFETRVLSGRAIPATGAGRSKRKRVDLQPVTMPGTDASTIQP